MQIYCTNFEYLILFHQRKRAQNLPFFEKQFIYHKQTALLQPPLNPRRAKSRSSWRRHKSSRLAAVVFYVVVKISASQRTIKSKHQVSIRDTASWKKLGDVSTSCQMSLKILAIFHVSVSHFYHILSLHAFYCEAATLLSSTKLFIFANKTLLGNSEQTKDKATAAARSSNRGYTQ